MVQAEDWEEGGDEARRWLLAAPISLLAGWTVLAAALNVGIAYSYHSLPFGKEGTKERCERCEKGYVEYPSRYFLFGMYSPPDDLFSKKEDLKFVAPVVSCCAVTAAIARPDPMLLPPLILATFFTKRSPFNFAAFVVCVGGVLVAFQRVYGII
jgi:hypothetical protein